MDVINPELQEIDGAFYRINITDYSAPIPAENISYREHGDDDYEGTCMRKPDDEEDEEIEVQVLENGRHRLKFHVARYFYPKIIGRQSFTKNRIEKETGTTIRIPSQLDLQNTEVVITSAVKERVLKAHRRIQQLVYTVRSKQPITHFVSVPMNNATVVQKFLTFKKQVLDLCSNHHGICEKLFQIPEKLHFTMCALVIVDNDEREIAVDILKQCREIIIDPILRSQPLRIQLRGIDCMNDDLSDVKILYCKAVDESGVFQKMANDINNYFSKTGLVKRLDETVKLHMTIMNTNFLKEETFDEEQKFRKHPTFDATRIFEEFKNYEFGCAEISNVHLSQCHTTDNDGYYKATHKVSYSY